MKIALGQLNTTVGDFSGNIEKARHMIDRAISEDVDLILFPELAISGYPPRDLVEVPHFVEKNLQALQDLCPLSERIGILIGHIAKNEAPAEKALYNAVSLLDAGQITYTYYKRLLPTYDVFDEKRYFASGEQSGLFTFRDTHFGVTICEDIWNDKLFWEKSTYAIDPVTELAEHGVDLILNISASPYGWDKELIREEMIRAVARRHQLPIYFCNLVGGNDELVFDGCSIVVNQNGDTHPLFHKSDS